jgi:hypothetical protein
MDEREAILFEADELHALHVKLREWDDKAKEVDRPIPDLLKYKMMAIEHLLT